MSIIVCGNFYKYRTPLPIDSAYPHMKYTPRIRDFKELLFAFHKPVYSSNQ